MYSNYRYDQKQVSNVSNWSLFRGSKKSSSMKTKCDIKKYLFIFHLIKAATGRYWKLYVM
jgi:hypothetical protein